MSKIKNAFANGKAFVAFVTCGDPDLETTEKIVKSMADNGADLIELGIPFSDPTAEGPVIQGASLRALNSGTTTDKIFDMVARIREYTDIPMVFMTYANVIFSYGAERFMEKVWGFDSETEVNVVWVYISYLRKKLASVDANVQIKAIRNQGYTLQEM